MLLRKIKTAFVRQSDRPLKKNWFHGDDCDLYVWQRENGGIVRFDLCLAIDGVGHLLRYETPGQMAVGRVDDEGDGVFKPTPLVQFDPALATSSVFARFCDGFLRRAAQVPGDLQAFILERLRWGTAAGPRPA